MLTMLVTPALPPSGPVRGSFECLFDGTHGRSDKQKYAAKFRFNEAFLKQETLNFPNYNPPKKQVEFVSFPIKRNIGQVEFASGEKIIIYNKAGVPVGHFLSTTKSFSSLKWFTFYTTADGGRNIEHGECIGDIEGRTERPVKLTEISVFWGIE